MINTVRIYVSYEEKLYQSYVYYYYVIKININQIAETLSNLSIACLTNSGFKIVILNYGLYY